jgi:hypothetical protein
MTLGGGNYQIHVVFFHYPEIPLQAIAKPVARHSVELILE